MLLIDDIVSDILRREGGFVDDPSDPGGETNHGVTIHTMRRLGIDVDGDGDVDIDDLRILPRDRAAVIFKQHYFVRPGITALLDVLQASVFDMYVSAGGAAVKILQRLLAKFGFPVAVDGVLGPLTILATNNALKVAPDHLANVYGIERRNYYYSLADTRVTSRKYAQRKDGGKGGWIARAEEFISIRYHLYNMEHIQMVAAWG
jgi:lysozyme family protein